MPRSRDRLWDALSAAGLVLLAAVALATFRDYGTTFDEEVQRAYGDRVLAWFASGFRDDSALTYKNLAIYGGLFEALVQLAVRVSPFGPYETRHLVDAAAGLLGVFATWRLGRLLGGPRAGFVAGALLALTPAFYGHAFANSKDVPLASLSALALFYVLRAGREAPRISPSAVLKAGVAIGAALGVRIGGAFLLGWLVLGWTAQAVAVPPADGAAAPAARRAGGALVRAAGAGAIAWATMLVAWPWAQLAPLSRPIEALRAASRFSWVGPMLFDGEVIRSDALPWRYLPTWFAITLPEAWFVALAAAVAVAARALLRPAALDRRLAIDVGVLGLAAGAPIAAAIVLRSVLYDAHRHFLFVLPPAAALAGLGLSRFVESAWIPRPVRAGVAGLAAASAVLTVVDLAQLHPYQYVYFNRAVAGGLPRAADRFETDYWGATCREGVETLVAHYRPLGPGPVTVANCSTPFLSAYWLERIPGALGRFVNVDIRAGGDPDVLLATSGCFEVPGRVLHVVERQGAPLLHVIERRPRGTWDPASRPP